VGVMIRVDGLVKKFGDFTAVDNISFEVPKGEIFAFLGPNGAGKTTTIKILTTLLKATSGTVEVDGRNPTTHENEVRQSFGIVFQDPSLDQDLTIPADHEFSSAADFLFVGSAVSAEQFAEGAVVCDETRSALVWSGWIARCAHWHIALWRDCGCRGACGRRRGAAWSRRVALLEDRDLAGWPAD
jgi:ABC-type oligopeptide transport system ATPase subunit